MLSGRDDFLIGGGALGFGQGIGLLGGIFFSGTAVGVVGEGYVRGWSGAWLDVALGLGFAVLLFTLLDRLRASGHANVATLLQERFGPLAGSTSAWISTVSWVALLAAFVSAAARSLEGLTGWDEKTAVGATIPVLLLYALPGGMRAVAAINLIQLMVLFIFFIGLAFTLPSTAAGSVTDPPIPWGYMVALTMLSAPTTVVAPDVVLGVASLKDIATARRTIAVVSGGLVAGGFFLAYLGARARNVVEVANVDQVLPRLVNVTVPAFAGDAGLALLFGASLAGAVSELMVCTYLIDEGLNRSRPTTRSLGGARKKMLLIAAVGGGLAAAYPHVVDTVVIAFRMFVPAVVPQVVAALYGVRVGDGIVLASMVLGSAVSTAGWALFPGTEMSVADPVLWGVVVSVSLLAWGSRRSAAIASGLHGTYEATP